MPRITKADLEKRVAELERQLENCQQWLIDAENKCNEVINNAETHLENLPAYKQAMERNAQLELINAENSKSLDRLRKKNTDLRDRVRELKEENQKLKESIKNQTVINDTLELDKLKQQNDDLQKQVDKLTNEKQQLKESIKNKTVINDTIHNARGAGRKPKDTALTQQQLLQLNELLQQGFKEKDICNTMQISRATYYRLKRLL